MERSLGIRPAHSGASQRLPFILSSWVSQIPRTKRISDYPLGRVNLKKMFWLHHIGSFTGQYNGILVSPNFTMSRDLEKNHLDVPSQQFADNLLALPYKCSIFRLVKETMVIFIYSYFGPHFSLPMAIFLNSFRYFFHVIHCFGIAPLENQLTPSYECQDSFGYLSSD